MSNSIIFKSIDEEHQINIEINEKVAWFEIIKIEYEQYKTFLLLLKDIVTFISSKNIEYIKQYISSDDVKFFNNSRIDPFNEKISIVTTKINIFPEETYQALGIKSN